MGRQWLKHQILVYIPVMIAKYKAHAWRTTMNCYWGWEVALDWNKHYAKLKALFFSSGALALVQRRDFINTGWSSSWTLFLGLFCTCMYIQYYSTFCWNHSDLGITSHFVDAVQHYRCWVQTFLHAVVIGGPDWHQKTQVWILTGSCFLLCEGQTFQGLYIWGFLFPFMQ